MPQPALRVRAPPGRASRQPLSNPIQVWHNRSYLTSHLQCTYGKEGYAIEAPSTQERIGFSLECPLPGCETSEEHLEHVGWLDVIEDAVEDVDAWEADRG